MVQPTCDRQTFVMVSAQQPSNSAEQRLPGHGKPCAPKPGEAVSYRHVAVPHNTGAPLEAIIVYATYLYSMR